MATTSVLGGVVRRKEDPALISGMGRYVDDIELTGDVAAAFVRSRFALARVTSIDAGDALALDGVIAVSTIEDVRDLGLLPPQVPVGALRPLLADGVVRHVGEAVAMEIARDRYTAQDGVDAGRVDDEPLEAVVSCVWQAIEEARG